MEAITAVNRVALGDTIRRAAGRSPGKLALIEGSKRITYRQLDEATNRFANYLLESGYRKGDSVATICGNSSELITAIFGIQKAGLVWVPVNPAVSLQEKLYILKDVEAKLIICDQEFLHDREEMEKICTAFLIIRGGENPVDRFEEALKSGNSAEPDVSIQDRDIAQIMYTSGTTGMPKGVMISHVSLYISSLANIVEIDIKRTDTGTAMMPIFHCAQHAVVLSFLHLGASLVVIRAFDPGKLLETIEREKITWTFALPIMYKAMLMYPARQKSQTESLRYCLYAMAAMGEGPLKKMMEEFDAQFSLGTGQTEMYPLTAHFKPEDQLRKKGSYWGTSSMINDTAIMSPNGEMLGTGEIGEIVHRGPNVMSGYLNQPEETKKSREFDWHHTGDLGYLDEEGLLVFVDRKKDIIKTGGENVASIVVEHTLISNDKVLNAVVVGLPHERWVEAITAFVILKPDQQATKEEIIEYCKEHLGSFQVPKEVLFVDELPSTSTGKIQKHLVRKQFESHFDNISASSS